MSVHRHEDQRPRHRRLDRAWADRSLRAKGLVVVAIPLAALIVAAVLFTLSLAQDRQAQGSVLRTVEVERQVAQLRILVQAGVTGYVLTGQERYLTSYEAASRNLPDTLRNLGNLPGDNPSQLDRLQQVRVLADRRSEILAALVASVKANSPQQSRGALLDRNKEIADALVAQLEAMENEEKRLLADRQAHARRARALTLGAIGLSVLLGLAGGVAAMVLFTSGVTRRAAHLEGNAERLAAGHELLPALPGNDALGALGRGLERAAVLLGEREHALREAKLAAEQANEAKSEYLSRMSHELRTPLNAILGFAQLLELDELTDEQRDNLRHILAGARHLLGLINEVLDIAAIEAGRLTLSLEPVSVAAVATETVSLIRPLADQHRILLVGPNPGPSSTTHVMGDHQRLKQILLNLLSNAVKYNREGGRVELACEKVAGQRLRIKVIDDGRGIADDSVERLFVPFERLEQGSSVEGAGLGLPLSKRLAEAMGGTLNLTSSPQGSTFWVELPLIEGPVQRAERELDLPAADPSERPAEALTVLYIEDNLSNLQLVEQVLNRRRGVKLISAMRPQLGLDLAGEHHPDLILLDLHLPDMPGEEVFRRLRAAQKTADIPVVILSADARPSLISDMLDQGARAFLTKPLDVKELLELLEGLAAEPAPAVTAPPSS
jgi:signal transduction histidine kinase/ActR/RegA family two-component response regulator